MCCSPDYYSAKKRVKTNMQAAAKKSTSWKQGEDCSAPERLETSASLLQPSKTGCAGCRHLRASHRAFLTAAVKTENTLVGMGLDQINWNHIDEKLLALKTTGKQAWTLQKLAKASSLTCIENHCTWESGKQLKQLYTCNNVLGQVAVQLGPFILSRLYIPSFLVLAGTAY